MVLATTFKRYIYLTCKSALELEKVCVTSSKRTPFKICNNDIMFSLYEAIYYFLRFIGFLPRFRARIIQKIQTSVEVFWNFGIFWHFVFQF